MGKDKIINPMQEHIDMMKGFLSEENEREAQASSGITADEALQKAFKGSNICYMGLSNNKPFICFGVIPYSVLSTTGVFWLMHTKDITKRRITVLRKSLVYINKMLSKFDMLENWVYHKNVLTIKWIKWCGFELEKLKPHGVKKELFHKFWIKRKGI